MFEMTPTSHQFEYTTIWDTEQSISTGINSVLCRYSKIRPQWPPAAPSPSTPLASHPSVKPPSTFSPEERKIPPPRPPPSPTKPSTAASTHSRHQTRSPHGQRQQPYPQFSTKPLYPQFSRPNDTYSIASCKTSRASYPASPASWPHGASTSTVWSSATRKWKTCPA